MDLVAGFRARHAQHAQSGSLRRAQHPYTATRRSQTLRAGDLDVDRAAFTIVSCGLTACVEAEARGETPPVDRARLEKLFLSLA